MIEYTSLFLQVLVSLFVKQQNVGFRDMVLLDVLTKKLLSKYKRSMHISVRTCWIRTLIIQSFILTTMKVFLKLD